VDRKGSESDIGGIGHLLEEAPDDRPRSIKKVVTTEVVPADVHQPDEATLPAARNRRCASKPEAVPLFVLIYRSHDARISKTIS
jgi:hypothetical protein